VHPGIPVTTPRCTLDDLKAAKLSRWQLSRAIEIAERLGASIDWPVKRTRSTLEDVFLDAFGESAIVNGEVEGLMVDFHWPQHRLIVETDGHETHGTRTAFERDRARDQRLIAAGWTVLRFTHQQVSEDPRRVREVLLSVRSRSLATRG
jgi:hypothetical protein